MSDIPHWPGRAFPLGATFDGEGTNFALFSEVASLVELCLFDERGQEHRLALDEVDAFSWHGYVPHVGPGQRYGYRVRGPNEPEQGVRCNPSKLLLDPYARAIEGEVRWNAACYGYELSDSPGFETLMRMRDFMQLTGPLRHSAAQPRYLDALRQRLEGIRSGDPAGHWRTM